MLSNINSNWPVGRAGLAVVIAGIILLGCTNPTEPSDERFTFHSATGDVHILLGSEVVITGGRLTVGNDNRIDQRLTLTCSVNNPGCTIPSDWERFQGIVDRTPVTPSGEMMIQWNDGRTSLLKLDGSTAWVGHPLPPSNGFVSQVTFRFDR